MLSKRPSGSGERKASGIPVAARSRSAKWLPEMVDGEGVHWIVLKEPINITAAHTARFVSLVGHNARPIQPLNQREIDEE